MPEYNQILSLQFFQAAQVMEAVLPSNGNPYLSDGPSSQSGRIPDSGKDFSEIILCRIHGTFDYLMYPYYPAYMG